jgi:hypothetical protein
VRRGVARLRAKTGRTKKGNPRGRRGERYTHPHTRTPRTRRRVASCSVRARTRLAVVCAPGPGPPPLPSVPGSPTPSLRPQQSARRGDTRAPCVPLPDLSLPLPAALRDPARTPGDKGASATLHAGSGRLVSRIGRLFETASRVDIALVTSGKVGSSDVDASARLRLRRSGSPWRKEELFFSRAPYDRARGWLSDARTRSWLDSRE